MQKIIYLDNAATTFPKPDTVYRAMDRVNRNGAVNAGRGSYCLAREASALIQETKDLIRKMICAKMNDPIIFSPSITIALNQVIQGYEWKKNENVYLSPYEHNAVVRTINHIAKEKKIKVWELPINPTNEEIDIEKMKYMFAKEPPGAIFCTHVSNVNGYVLPIQKIFSEGKKYSSLNVLDTAQSLGLINIDVRVQRDIDIIAFTGHKCLYGPFGIGGFINLSNIELSEFIVGGTGTDSLNLNMPKGPEIMYEAASSNIISISGLNAALKEIDVKECYNHEIELTKHLISELDKIDHIKVFAPYNREKHIGIVSFVVEGMTSEDVGDILDVEYGIAVRTGYHCSPLIHKYIKSEEYLGTIRVSLSQYTTKEELDIFINAIREIQ